jgi:hypothetical protein
MELQLHMLPLCCHPLLTSWRYPRLDKLPNSKLAHEGFVFGWQRLEPGSTGAATAREPGAIGNTSSRAVLQYYFEPQSGIS